MLNYRIFKDIIFLNSVTIFKYFFLKLSALNNFSTILLLISSRSSCYLLDTQSLKLIYILNFFELNQFAKITIHKLCFEQNILTYSAITTQSKK